MANSGLPTTVDPFQKATEELISTLSDRWIAFPDLNEPSEQALAWLVANGMVAVRITVDVTHRHESGCVRCEFSCTGEYDVQTELAPRIRAKLPAGWDLSQCRVHCDSTAVRLTEDGILAQQDTAAGQWGAFWWHLSSHRTNATPRSEPKIRDLGATWYESRAEAPVVNLAIQNNVTVEGHSVVNQIDTGGQALAEVLQQMTGVLSTLVPRSPANSGKPAKYSGKWAMVYAMLDERGTAPLAGPVRQAFIADYNQKFANKSRGGKSKENWPELDEKSLSQCVKDWPNRPAN